ncbi:MAG: DeoR family transcriptional regulator [Candidatus Giovannonibacteria bacterium]|nr:DeoR family transcriptional regulator [Candidatus Giovannonibacteria bacterium]
MFEELKQRALKITEALYRTTDLFSDAEPLKWALRKEALDILNAQPRDILTLEATVKNMLLKLELAACGTFISKKNFDVLGREYMGLLDIILTDTAPIGQIEIKAKPEIALKPNSRQETLISSLKEKGRLSVGDLTKALGEPVSEKTVQRELSTLVASGAVKQEGDKRWRRYFI